MEDTITLVKIQISHIFETFASILLKTREMGQISSEHQGHLDTFALVNSPTGGWFKVKNDQFTVVCQLLRLHRTGHQLPAAHLFLKTSLKPCNKSYSNMMLLVSLIKDI